MRRILKKQEVRDAIGGVRRPPAVPVQYTTWFNPLVFSGFNFIRSIWCRVRYPDDIAVCAWHDLRWHLYHMNKQNGSFLRCVIKGLGQVPTPKKKYLRDNARGMDANVLCPDMSKLDEFLKRLPDPHKVPMLFPGPSLRYKVAWNMALLFEHHWLIRGMENALTDFYLYPEETHRLYRFLTDYAKVKIERSRKLCRADAVFFGDDVGTQTGPFFSPEIFREFFYPYYKELIDYTHSLGMHFWLHTCGNVSMFMDMFVEMGLDVIHPIQKYAMDEKEIFNKYKDKITFMYGFDMQRVIPDGTPDEVEAEAKRVMDLFAQAETGRFVLTSGNVFTGDCPIKSLERLMRVTHTYNPYKKTGDGKTEEPRKSGGS